MSRLALSNPHVQVAITGPGSDEELRHALSASTAVPLTPDETQRVRPVEDWIHAIPSFAGCLR